MGEESKNRSLNTVIEQWETIQEVPITGREEITNPNKITWVDIVAGREEV